MLLIGETYMPKHNYQHGTSFGDALLWRITPMDDKDYITRIEFEERGKRIDDENRRQNHRLDKLEKIADQLTDMAASIKAMVVTMQGMQKEQERQGKRLDDIEEKPSKRWDLLVNTVLTVIATAAVTLLIKGGM